MIYIAPAETTEESPQAAPVRQPTRRRRAPSYDFSSVGLGGDRPGRDSIKRSLVAGGDILTGVVTGPLAIAEAAGRIAFTGEFPEKTFFEEAHRGTFEGLAKATGTERAFPEAHKSLLRDFKEQLDRTQQKPSLANYGLTTLFGGFTVLEALGVGALAKGGVRAFSQPVLARTVGKQRLSKIGYTDAVERIADQKKYANIEEITVPTVAKRGDIPEATPLRPLRATEGATLRQQKKLAKTSKQSIPVIKEVPDNYLIPSKTINKAALATANVGDKRLLTLQPQVAEQYNKVAQSDYGRLLLTHDKTAYDSLVLRLKDRVTRLTDDFSKETMTKAQFNASIKSVLNETKNGIANSLRAILPQAVKKGNFEPFLKDLNRSLNRDIENFPKNATKYIYDKNKPIQSEITMLSRQFRDNLKFMKEMGLKDIPSNPIAALKKGVYEKVVRNKQLSSAALGEEVYQAVRKNYTDIVGRSLSKSVIGKVTASNVLSGAEKTQIRKHVDDLVKRDLNLPQLTVRMRDIEDLLNRELTDVSATRAQLDARVDEDYLNFSDKDPVRKNDITAKEVRQIGKDLKEKSKELQKFEGTPQDRQVLQREVDTLQNDYEQALALNSFVVTDNVNSFGALFSDPAKSFIRTLKATRNPITSSYAARSMNEMEWGSFRKFMTNADGETLNPVVAKIGGDAIGKAYNSHTLGQNVVNVNLSNPLQKKVRRLAKKSYGDRVREGQFYGEFAMPYMAWAELDRGGVAAVKRLKGAENSQTLDDITDKMNQMLEYAGSEKRITANSLKDNLLKHIDTTDTASYERTAQGAIRNWAKNFMGAKSEKIYKAQQDAYDGWMKNYGDPEFNKLAPNSSLLLNKIYQRRTNYMPVRYLRDDAGKVVDKADEFEEAVSDAVLNSSLDQTGEATAVRLGQPTGEREFNVVKGVLDPNWVKNLGQSYLKQRMFNDVATDLYSSVKLMNKMKAEGQINENIYQFMRRRLSYITSYSKADQMSNNMFESVARFFNLSQVYTAIATPYYRVGSYISDKTEIIRDMTRAQRQFIPTADAWLAGRPDRINGLEKYLPELKTDISGRHADIGAISRDVNIEQFGGDIRFKRKGEVLSEKVLRRTDWAFSKPSQWFINASTKGARIKSLTRFALYDYFKKNKVLPKTADQLFGGDEGLKRLERARLEVDTKIGSTASLTRPFASTEGSQIIKNLTLFSGFGVRNGDDVANSFFKNAAARKAGKPKSSDTFAAPLSVMSRQLEADATYQWGKLATRQAVAELLGFDDEVTADPKRITSYVAENVAALPFQSTRIGVPVTDTFRSLLKGYQVSMFDQLPSIAGDIGTDKFWRNLFRSTPLGVFTNPNSLAYPMYRITKDMTTVDGARKAIDSNLIRIYREDTNVVDAFRKSDNAWNTGDGYVVSLKKHLGTLNLSKYTKEDYDETSFEMFRNHYFKPSASQKIVGDNYNTGLGEIDLGVGEFVNRSLRNPEGDKAVVKNLRYVYNLLSLSNDEFVFAYQRGSDVGKNTMVDKWTTFRDRRTGEIKDRVVNRYIEKIIREYERAPTKRDLKTREPIGTRERDRRLGSKGAVSFYVNQITAMADN